MTKQRITLLAIGDIVIFNREEPETIFAHVADVLQAADIAFANCDQQYSDKGYKTSHVLRSDTTKVVPALVYTGLDVVSLANNHALDWGPEALLDTIDRIRNAGIPVVGAGKNITEARRPVILERKGNRVGFLAYGCVGPDGYEALEDKPGYAPMRAWTIYEKWDYQPGTPPRIVTIPYKDDLATMEEDIRKLKARVDVVAVSFHWGLHFVPVLIPMYEFEVGHAAIDAGADIILGGHPHILKGIEVYKGKVIFHSLGNFALDMRSDAGDKSFDKLNKRMEQMYQFKADPEYPTYPMHPEAKATVIAKAVIGDGEIKKVSYIPCYINKKSEPEIKTRSDPRGQEVFSYIQKISRSLNLPATFTWKEDEVVIS